MNRQPFRERYQHMAWPQQMGNLASTLARLSSRCIHPEHDAVVNHLLREAALLIEWSASSTGPATGPAMGLAFQMDLASMQREILAWHRSWPVDQARSILALRARQMSDTLLRVAGLAGPSIE